MERLKQSCFFYIQKLYHCSRLPRTNSNKDHNQSGHCYLICGRDTGSGVGLQTAFDSQQFEIPHDRGLGLKSTSQGTEVGISQIGIRKEGGREGYYFCLSVCVEARDLGLDMTSVLRSPPLSQQADDLSNPFGQMSLSRQGSTEAADPSSALFQPPLISQHPQQTSFIMASTGQPLPTSNYSTSSHAPPTQQVLPPQGYMQPPQQVSGLGFQSKS